MVNPIKPIDSDITNGWNFGKYRMEKIFKKADATNAFINMMLKKNSTGWAFWLYINDVTPIEITRVAKQAFNNNGLLNLINKSINTITEKKKTAK